MTYLEQLDKVARIALAIQRGGHDKYGDVDSIHRDFMDLLRLIIRNPKENT